LHKGSLQIISPALLLDLYQRAEENREEWDEFIKWREITLCLWRPGDSQNLSRKELMPSNRVTKSGELLSF